MSQQNEPPVGGEHPLSELMFAWTRRPGVQKTLVVSLIVGGLAAFALEALLAYKPMRDPGSIPGFHALFGFLAFGGAVLSGWPLGRFLRRKESYYEQADDGGDLS